MANEKVLKECIELSSEILKNIELSEISMAKVILKCLRLCRLLNIQEGIEIFSYENTGYPRGSEGKLTKHAWELCGIMNRRYHDKDKDNVVKEYAFTETINTMEQSIAISQLRMTAANDPSHSITSANPNQYIYAPHGNALERNSITNNIRDLTERLTKVSGSVYNYILNIHTTLVYGDKTETIFENYRKKVNSKLSKICPETIKKFMSVYENLESENSENWANAAHSCRRIIKDIADVLYPPTNEIITIGKKEIKLGEEQFINRLIQYIDKFSKSETFKSIIGSTLQSIGERIDAIHSATCKGTHAEVSKAEAERYIIYTYLIIGDILELSNEAIN